MAKLSPFDFINDITYSKQDIMNHENETQYIPFIVNRGLSYFADTVHYANDMNLNNSLTNRLQYVYFLNTITKRKRFSKWAKKIDNKDLAVVMKVYQCNATKGSEILSILTPDQLETVKQLDAGTNNERRRVK